MNCLRDKFQPKRSCTSCVRQPAALKEKIVQKLHEMERNHHIAKVEQPLKWVSSMVAVTRGGKVRICFDPSILSKVLKR